jgi:hypothetical protein
MVTKGTVQQNNTEDPARSNVSIKIPLIADLKFENVGTYGLKTGFISIISVLLLIYSFFVLKIQLVQSLIVVCFLSLLFLLLWKLGCNDTTQEGNSQKNIDLIMENL